MDNSFDKLKALIHEMQSQEGLQGCFIIMADTSAADEKKGQLLCAVQGKRNQLMDMILGAFRSDSDLKKMILDALLFNTISGIIDKEKECGCADCKCKDEHPGNDVE